MSTISPYNLFTADGTTSAYVYTFTLSSYSKVRVYINGIETTAFTQNATTSTITLTSIPVYGSTVLLQRYTSRDIIQKLVTGVSNGSTFNAIKYESSKSFDDLVANQLTDILLENAFFETLNNTSSGVTPGVYGSETTVPVITVNTSGSITNVIPANIRQGTTSATGLLQLSTSTNSTSTTLAATSSAVKLAYDLANAAIPSSLKSVANGVATLDINGLVPNAQLPVVNASSTLSTARAISLGSDATGSANFDGSTNITIPVTLVNSGVTASTYNNSVTAITPFTVDAKGRITGTGTSVTITPAWSSVTSKPTTIAGYAMSDFTAMASTAPLISGTATVGTSTTAARADHIHPTDTTRAPIASPTFTGTVTAPTFVGALTGTASTASTANALNSANAYTGTSFNSITALSSTTPLINGTATIGTSTTVARADHIHPTDTTRAPLASPTFTGTPTVPTVSSNTSNTQIASTAFTQSAIQNSVQLLNTQTGTAYTLVLTDINTHVEMNNASANTITVPLNSSVAFPIGTQLTICQYGVGQTTIVATSGVTIRNNHATLNLNGQYASCTLFKRGLDEWCVEGNLAAS